MNNDDYKLIENFENSSKSSTYTKLEKMFDTSITFLSYILSFPDVERKKKELMLKHLLLFICSINKELDSKHGELLNNFTKIWGENHEDKNN